MHKTHTHTHTQTRALSPIGPSGLPALEHVEKGSLFERGHYWRRSLLLTETDVFSKRQVRVKLEQHVRL